MMRLSKLTSALFRFLIVWTVDTISLLTAAILLPSVVLSTTGLGSALAAALMLGLVTPESMAKALGIATP